MAVVFASAGWRAAAALLLVVYGGFGLNGLGHYWLALCSQHTLTMNATIWAEALAGAALAIGANLGLRSQAFRR